MNQTRTFLIFAWLVVATLLYMAWTQEQAAPPATATPATQEVATATGAAPKLPAAAPTMSAAPVSQAGTADAPAVTVTTDVLRVVLDGGAMRQADLLAYPQTTEPGADPVRLFASDPARFYQAQSGWVSSEDSAPTHDQFRPLGAPRSYTLAAGQDTLAVPFEWTGPDGVSIRRTYTFQRGD